MAQNEIAKVAVGVVPTFQGISGKLKEGLAPLDQEAEAAGRRSGKAVTKGFNAELDAFGTKTLIGAGVVGAGLFGLASAAGNLEAALAANVQVLGDASDAVQTFAADGTDAVFLTETAALDAATSFGQLGKVMGLTGDDLSTLSIDLVELAADMAAFKNVTPTQALEDLQSAFAGQPEVMRKYGVFLDEATLKQAYFDETGVRVTGTLTAQQRLIATNAELWRQTGDIQGQAAREADSFESSIAGLKETVGNVAADFGAPLVGFAAELISNVSGGITQISDWNEATGGMLASGLGAGVGIAAVVGGLTGVGIKIKGAVDKFQDLARWQKTATLATGGLSLAIIAGFTAYGLMTAHSRELEAQTKTAGAALDVATTEAWELAEAAAGASGDVDALAVAQSALGRAVLESFGELDPELIGKFGLQADELGAALLDLRGDPLASLQQLGEAAGLTSEDAELLAVTLDRFAETDNDFTTEGDSLSTYVRQLGGEFNVSKEEADAFAERVGALGGNLEDLLDAANTMSESEIASVFLNQKVASDELAESLVEQAEANSDASRNGEDAYAVYVELLDIVSKLPPEERAAAEAALGFGEATSTAARETEGLTTVAADTIDMMTDAEEAFSDAADQADAFSSAVDRLIGGQLGLQAARDDLQAGYDELTDSIERAIAGEEGFSLSLSKNSQEGRDNRAMIRDNVDNILAMSDALIENGASVENASATLRGQREELIGLIQPFFETRQAAEDYIDQLGLTPENIDTAVELSNVEATKQRITDYQAELGDIPEWVATEVEAHVDDGAYNLAEQRLAWLARVRRGVIHVSLSGANTYGSGIAMEQAAHGAFASTPRTVEYGHGPEWIAPLSRPYDMKYWLKNPEIREPVMEALDLEPQLVGVGGGGRSGAPMIGGDVYVGDRSDLAQLNGMFETISFRLRYGG